MSEYRDEAILIVNRKPVRTDPSVRGLRTLHENIDGLIILGFHAISLALRSLEAMQRS